MRDGCSEYSAARYRFCGWATMSIVGASRFTALLAAVAISGMAGVFWWALDKRSDIAASGHRRVTRVLPTKFSGRVPGGRDGPSGQVDSNSADPNKADPNRSDPNKSDPNKFMLMGRSERTADQDADHPPAPLLANFPAGPPP